MGQLALGLGFDPQWKGEGTDYSSGTIDWVGFVTANATHMNVAADRTRRRPLPSRFRLRSKGREECVRRARFRISI
jgi:hypothetical protein